MRMAGLQHRYDVRKVNDPEGKHDHCRYFVLDPQHDPIARVALRTYAEEARRDGYVELADDLLDWVGRCPFFGKEPHGPHEWIDIGIGGETTVRCEGVARIEGQP